MFFQKCRELESVRPICKCGCAKTESSKVVGLCLHCGHVYANYSPAIEARYFAYSCAGVAEELKKSARNRLATPPYRKIGEPKFRSTRRFARYWCDLSNPLIKSAKLLNGYVETETTRRRRPLP